MLAIVAAIALVPGLYRFWSGRQFRSAAADAALAERWWASRSRASQLSLAAAISLTFLRPAWLGVTLPVLLLASAIGGFPDRQAVFGESWRLASYLVWGARLVAGVWGLWIVLALVPWWLPASLRPIGSIAAAVALFLWSWWYGPVLRVLLKAQPLDPAAISPELTQRFAAVLDRSSVRNVGLWRAGPPQSVLANAVALPSLHRPSVLFSNALLDALTPREVAAILAHELGHLEHFTRRRLLVSSATTAVLICAATIGVPRLSDGGLGGLMPIWPLMLLCAFVLRSRRQQANESASDGRACELCGDPEALASGLIALHTRGRVPRRWSASFEQHATHPSLARRLAAIRARTRPDHAPTDTTLIAGSDGRTWLVIEPDRVRHLSGVPPGTVAETAVLATAAHTAVSIAYADVREMHVSAKRGANAELRISNVRGDRWVCPLQADDLERLQRALDRVDHLIAPPERGASLQPLLARALGTSVAIAGALSSAPVLVGLGLLLAVAPSPSAAVGTGIGAAVAALAAFAGVPWLTDDLVLRACVAVVSVLLLIHASRWRPSRVPRYPWILPGILAAAAAVVWCVAAGLAFNLLVLHRLAVVIASATLLPMALGGALWRQRPSRRRMALAAWGLALVPAVVASPLFPRYALQDPLLTPLAAIPVTALALETIAEGPLPGNASSPRVSSDGRYFAAQLDADDYGEPSGQFVVGTVGQPGATITAADVAFLDDERLLVLKPGADGMELVTVSVTDVERPIRRLVLDAPASSHLVVDPPSGRWRVVGSTAKRFARIDGSDAGEPQSQIWSSASASYQQIVDDGTELLEVAAQDVGKWSRRYSLSYLLDLGLPMTPAVVNATDGRRTRQIVRTSQDLQCEQPIPGRQAVCLASDGGSTRVWRLESGTFRGVGELTGTVFVNGTTPAGELALWRGRDHLLLDPVEGLAFRLEAGGRERRWMEWTSAGGTVAAIASGRETLTIRTFDRRSH